MRKPALVLAVMTLGMVPVLPAHRAVAQPPKTLDRMALEKRAAALAGSGWQRSVWSQGSCQTGDAKPARKMVWAAVMACTVPNPQTVMFRINAGFHLPALSSAGPIQNARVVATFKISQVTGQARLVVGVVPVGMGGGPPHTSHQVTVPGTYEVTGNPITLEANNIYEAGAWVRLSDNCGEMCGIVAKITQLTWVF